jgi:hypothetical protein
MNPAPEPIAVARSYDDLREAIAAWCRQIGMSRADLDVVAGLTDGHAAKLLTKRQVKRFGNRTLGPVLAATGLMLIVAVDPEAADVFSRKQRRELPDAASRTNHWRHQKGAAWGRRMAALRRLKLPSDRRREIARKAAKARWDRQRTPPQTSE